MTRQTAHGINALPPASVTRLVDVSNARLINAYVRHHRSRYVPRALRDRELLLQRLARWLAEPQTPQPLPGCTLVGATSDHLAEFVAGLSVGRAREAAVISALRRFYRWLIVHEQARDDDPTIRLESPRLPKWEPRPADEDEAREALRLAHTEPVIYLWLRLAWFSGLRVCQIASIRADSMYRKGDRYWLRVSGKGRTRAVALDKVTAELLRTYLRGRSGAAFTGPRGPYQPHRLGQIANRFLRNHGLHFTMHQLRHGFATNFYDCDPDALLLRDALGHASLNTTMVYTRIAVARAAVVVQASADRHDPHRRTG